MNFIKRRFSLKLGIIALTFLLSINLLDFNSVIRANENNKNNIDSNYEINEKLTNNYNQIDNKAGTYKGKIDFRSNFVFRGAKRKQSNIDNMSKSDLNLTTQYGSTDNYLRIGASHIAAYHKQSVFANSNFTLDLNRPFEFESSFKMGKFNHGYVMAMHQKTNFQPRGTDGSLGVYYDEKRTDRTKAGLENAFIMEFDYYRDTDGAFGDNKAVGSTRKHFTLAETNGKGEYDQLNTSKPKGKTIKHVDMENNDIERIFNKQEIKYKVSWNGRQGLEIRFLTQGMEKFNYKTDNEPTLIAMKGKNNGKIYLSFGGTLDNAGTDIIELGIHSFRYLDLDPKLYTDIYDADTNKKIDAVTPGQKITVHHRMFNLNGAVGKELKDGLTLNMLYLQFANKKQIEDTLYASNNLDVKNVETWSDVDGVHNWYDKFDTKTKIPARFPSGGKYYNVRYTITVPTSVNRPENYGNEFYLYFLSNIGQENVVVDEFREKTQVHLRPNIITSKTGTVVKNNHEIFKYNGNISNQIDKTIVRNQLWEKMLLYSTADREYQLKVEDKVSLGTNIQFKYYLNGNATDIFNNPKILLNKGDAITLAIEAVDNKITTPVLKSYYYRTLVLADNVVYSEDGNNILYSNNNTGNKSETYLNKMTVSEFQNEIKNLTSVNAIKRNYVDSFTNFASFSNEEKSISVQIRDVNQNYVDMKSGTYQLPMRFNVLELSANYRVDDKTYTFDNNSNIPDGNTGYVVIPKTIKISDSSDGKRIIGKTEVFAAGYISNKKYIISVDSTIKLSSVDNKSIILNVNKENTIDASIADNKNGKIELGKLTQSNKKGNGLKLTLSGDKYPEGNVTFKGKLNFYFKFSWD